MSGRKNNLVKKAVKCFFNLLDRIILNFCWDQELIKFQTRAAVKESETDYVLLSSFGHFRTNFGPVSQIPVILFYCHCARRSTFGCRMTGVGLENRIIFNQKLLLHTETHFQIFFDHVAFFTISLCAYYYFAFIIAIYYNSAFTCLSL